ncbi:helix-turn-helix domain-containing protein [Lutimaribacter marinistellae]|uniref:Helix-turn-helix domain-containing protein n=1 Tax=Lutimaribacter marinistellae TaxID=1820329 RepID=A0ABV7TL09_9RHOB
MPHSIPLIRAAAITPIRRWVEERGEDVGPFLARADLSWVPADDPALPVPLRSVVRLLVEISRAAGPDTPHRIVNGRGGFEIGLIGRAAFRGPTVRDGFARIARMMPAHCTHEIFTVALSGDGLHIRDGWAYDLGDDEALYLVQQYVASLIDMICSVAHPEAPRAERVEMVPHPEAGLNHLRPWLGDRLQPAPLRALDFLVGSDVAAQRFPKGAQERAREANGETGRRIASGASLADQVSALVAVMLPRTTPHLDRVAAAAGISGRTLRRALRQNGTSFSDVVERTRAQIAVDRVRNDTDVSLGSIAADLGYANQATLSRAVRRWTGQTPRSLRSGLKSRIEPGKPVSETRLSK